MHLSSAIYLIIFTKSIVTTTVVSDFEEHSRGLYNEFKQTHRKYYSTDDDIKRFAIFKDNLKRAETYQENERGTAKYGVTQFSDLTPQEFKDQYTNARPKINDKRVDNLLLGSPFPAPERYDWRERGAVGPVLKQGKCAAGWAFAVTGNIEAVWFRKTGKLLSLSQQQLLDCDEKAHGCQGGSPSKTYREIKRIGGLQLSSDYPYKAKQYRCEMDRARFKVYINSSLELSTNESNLAAWLVQLGPLVSEVIADPLQFYVNGIMHPLPESCPADGRHHNVLIVGYGGEHATPFWIVKNSYGEHFGENGYFRIYRGDGSCRINEACSSAIIY